MQASALLLHWGSYRRARNVRVLIIYFSSLLCCPLCFQGSAQIRQWESFQVFGNFSLFKTPFPGLNSIPPSFVPFFCLLHFSLPPFEDLGCLSGCLMSSAGIQKLFCGIYLVFKCSFDEFVGEKVFSPSYSSAILAPPLDADITQTLKWSYREFFKKISKTYISLQIIQILTKRV